LPIRENSRSGWTVGPWAPDGTEALFDSLADYLARAAEFGWIRDPQRASFYRQQFALAGDYIAGGNTSGARQTLEQTAASASQDSGVALSPEALILVRQNCTFLLSHLSPGVHPAVTALRPAMTLVNAGSFEVSISGTGFRQGAEVLWNGTPRITMFVADTLLRATVTASDVAAAAQVPVTVRNPDGPVSSPLTFAVVSALPQPVRPVLECVVKNSSTSYTAWFGYKNENTVPVYIPVGAKNKFTPSPQNRGQTTVFDPSRRVKVYSVEFNGSNLVWTLNGRTSTASKSSTRCK
jgi:hypothetical protein